MTEYEEKMTRRAAELVGAERLLELAEADSEMRLRVYPRLEGKNCGTCGNFRPNPGRASGRCAVHPWARNRWGRESDGYPLVVSRSRNSCRQYVEKGAGK